MNQDSFEKLIKRIREAHKGHIVMFYIIHTEYKFELYKLIGMDVVELYFYNGLRKKVSFRLPLRDIEPKYIKYYII